jgi:dTDP-4-amino-4,6-dideoxygalactose transaminase
MSYTKKDLAINGGPKAKTTANLPMFPGGLEIGQEEKKEVMEVLDNKYLFRYYGPKESPSKVSALEEQYAKFLGSKHCLALNSCTSALISALVAMGVGPGDEVIVPSYTFFATCAAVVAARAIPIVAEVDKSLTMDPADFEKKITSRTKAVIPVHMRGMPAKIDRIVEIARKYGVKVVEDVAQANGGTFRGPSATSAASRCSSTRSSHRGRAASSPRTPTCSTPARRPTTTWRPAGARTGSRLPSSRGKSFSA